MTEHQVKFYRVAFFMALLVVAVLRPGLLPWMIIPGAVLLFQKRKHHESK